MIEELKWDSNLFGRKMGRLTRVPSKRSLQSVIDKARKDNYRYLTCRFSLDRISEIQRLEKVGFYVTDLGVVWERKTGALPAAAVSVRKATMEDAAMLRKMGKGLFADGRFYNDPFFTHDEADRLYQIWTVNSLRDKDIQTFVAANKGFVTCKRLSSHKGDIPLVGVIRGQRGKGVGRSLINAALDWFQKAGIRRVTVRTQANNIRAMNFYKELGFVVKYVDMTMGKILTMDEFQ